MLKSMTGYGEGAAESADWKVRVEVKTVNQRFLDIAFHTPKLLNAEEAHMRDRIKQTVARGKLDLFVTVEDLREKSAEIRVDRKLALAYHQALNEMSDLLRVARPDDVATIASYPDVLSVEETASFEGGEPVLDEALDKALSALDTMRQTEGENLKQDFLHRIETLSGFVEKLRTLAPDIVAHYRERLQATMDELLSAEDIDETRIIEETALYADKVNFTEEVVRLESHFAQFRAIIEGADAPVGRKLDFLIQEMNREANTIGSKCQSAEAAQTVVDMKSEIEKLREQVQNIE
ncbi:MAG: YicC/YloC family endoribonuclease [Selenomonas sp.]|uniref:YicC/YloC family endoribonuclease n=1 Tax=uncultured Selenomonas sp. TaxID=159275 RepID=UPI0025E86D5A|nr:YicC/YloC family endoribonuclease [uncultured Selenomonas sp.]MDD6127262.1 YicC family protein [Veillonellaceae bacterium]MDD6698993.1 YicC family protein [Veillonellaceae bacterium]MDY6351118.1 YicC/YloC family endoribonuclease [Selenomonas sp.]